MTSTEGQTTRSPWFTVWFSPGQTIERLVADRPKYRVWLLAILGVIATVYQQAATVGAAGLFRDWRYALGLVLLGVVGGIAWLYLSALIVSWVGRLLGGRAAAQQVRAVFAWSMLPTIVGGVIALAIVTAMGEGEFASDVATIPVAIATIWSLLLFLLMLARAEHFGFWRTIVTYALSIVLMAFGLAIFIRSLVYQSFSIPSSSMRPTLMVGDYIFVSKFAYGYSRFSLPFSPSLFSGRIFASSPARGDVVVFRFPKQDIDYVKRLVGMPGDHIQMKQGQLYINDAPVKRERLADVTATDACGGGGTGNAKRWRETLPGGASYETLDCVDNGFLDNTDVITVPDGEFFMLGDNRDNSSDSRRSEVGFVPLENLIGRVDLIYFSYDEGSAGTPAHVRDERIGKIVH